jgi:hypothetical protein
MQVFDLRRQFAAAWQLSIYNEVIPRGLQQDLKYAELMIAFTITGKEGVTQAWVITKSEGKRP